jgi:hypothetical protein
VDVEVSPYEGTPYPTYNIGDVAYIKNDDGLLKRTG